VTPIVLSNKTNAAFMPLAEEMRLCPDRLEIGLFLGKILEMRDEGDSKR